MTVDAVYCPRCGARLPHRPPVSCASCGYSLYVNAKPTGSAIILNGDQYLVVRRAIEPQLGRWDLPGGYADAWEHPADATVREAKEELGVDIALGDFVGMFIGGVDQQGERLPVLDCYWTASIVAGEIELDQQENSEYAWFALADPPDLAFPTANAAIAALRTLRSRRGGNPY
jgi:ADP-ribose pyrophosphatase YjhB (NUDIX family)